MAEPCDGVVNESTDVILLADVGVDELGLGTERAQFLDKRLAGVIAPTGDDHFRALLGESDSGDPPNAGESAGDQDDWIAHDLLLAICSALP
jgi:hypothetical protein